MALTDADIDTLVREPKSVTLRRPWLLRMKQKGRHLERDFDLRGARGSKFRLIIRQNQLDPADFSIILGLIRSRSRRLFHLRRYKGNSHGHTNKIEREAFLDFHIHVATTRYQNLTGADEDGFATSTSRYNDLCGAFQCMREDCALLIPAELEQALFEEVR